MKKCVLLKQLVLITLSFFIVAMSSSVEAVNDCCGKTSKGDPYPCHCSSKSNTGNCTWFAWYKAKKEWNKSLPNWHDAGKWAKNAKNSGYKVTSSPDKNRIAVNTNVAGYGHVAWVTKVKGSYVTVDEMNWCSTCKQSKTYPKYWFDGGYIKKKS
jgi:surface antigen